MIAHLRLTLVVVVKVLEVTAGVIFGTRAFAVLGGADKSADVHRILPGRNFNEFCNNRFNNVQFLTPKTLVLVILEYRAKAFSIAIAVS